MRTYIQVKLALRQLQVVAAAAAATEERVRAEAQGLRQRAERDLSVAELARASEEAAAAYVAVQKHSAGAQLGAVLKGKGMKVGDIVSKWGGTDEMVDIHEWRKEVKLTLTLTLTYTSGARR